MIERLRGRIRVLGVTLHSTGECAARRPQALDLIMGFGEQAHRIMIRDRSSDFTAVCDAVPADAGIRTMVCNVRMPRMNAIGER